MEQDELIEMAMNSGLPSKEAVKQQLWWLESFAKLVASVATEKAVEREREACAKVCEYRQDGYELSGFTREFTAARACTKAIRARGEPTSRGEQHEQ